MAVTTPQTNNKLVKYRREIINEYVRENLFSPYMGDDINAIIRTLSDLKNGGEQVNIPIVQRLKNEGRGRGTLVGNEEKIDNYGMRVWVDWARNAVVTTKADEQVDSADIFGEAKPLLSNWGKELQRDEIIAALFSIPSESAPAGLNSDAGQRVNGIRFEDATTAQKNAWNVAQNTAQRVLYGSAVSNYNATFATALATVDTTNDQLSTNTVSLAKRRAKAANPKMRPYQLKDGREYFVGFTGSYAFRDLKNNLNTINQNARPREGSGMDKNPIFQDGDLLYDGVIIREIPEITTYIDDYATQLLTAGTSSSRVEPFFLCGQGALAMPWAQMPRPTFRKEDDYGFITGAGIEMCYGVAKVFTKSQIVNPTSLIDWGVLTTYVSGAAD